jgi:hypothetical protein
MSQAKKDPHFFNSDDFKKTEWLVVMRNVTTSYELPKGQKAEVTEIEKKSLTIQVPKNSCTVGHCLLLRVFKQEDYERVRNSPRSVQDKAHSLSLTAKVKEITPTNGDRILAVLELQQYVEKEWLGFLETFAKLQKKVNTIVKRIKE